MVKSRLTELAVFGAAVVLMLPAQAGEKIQIKGSTSIELPKPRHSLEEDIKSFRLNSGPSGQSEYDSGVASSTPVNTVAPQMDKKMQEALDKKKNWIFVNPYEMQFDSKTEEFMKGEKGTGLYEHRLMQGDDKSILEKFMDERNPNLEKDPNDPNLSETERERMGQNDRNGLRDDNDPRINENSGLLTAEKTQSLEFKLDQKASFTGERSLFQQRLERNRFSENTVSGRFSEERSTVSIEDFRKEREARDTEFNKLFQPRGFTPPVASAFDPLNNAPDATRQEVNPIGARRSEQFLNIGRSEASGGGAAGSRNSSLFSGPASGVSLPGRSGSEIFGAGFGSGIGRPTAVSPSASFAPPPVSRAPSSPTSFTMPRVQRKF